MTYTPHLNITTVHFKGEKNTYINGKKTTGTTNKLKVYYKFKVTHPKNPTKERFNNE